MAAPLQHQQRPNFPWQVFTATNTNEGIPWYRQFDEPRFERKVPVHLMPTNFHTQQPNLTAGIAGIAWHKPWEPPFFPTKVKPELQQTQMWDPRPSQDFSLIQGMAWYYAWDQPKQRKTDVNAHQTQAQVQTPPAILSTIRGIAWRVQFSEPRFEKKVPVYLMKTEAIVFRDVAVKISGMAWYTPFDQPKQRKTDFVIQQTSMWSSRSQPAVFARGYIIGPA